MYNHLTQHNGQKRIYQESNDGGCRRGGATATLQTMNMMFEMMNMPVVTSQYWNIAYGAGKGEVKLDTEGMQTMRTLATNMAFLLQKIHADGHPAPQRDERPAFMNFIR